MYNIIDPRAARRGSKGGSRLPKDYEEEAMLSEIHQALQCSVHVYAYYECTCGVFDYVGCANSDSVCLYPCTACVWNLAHSKS